MVYALSVFRARIARRDGDEVSVSWQTSSDWVASAVAVTRVLVQLNVTLPLVLLLTVAESCGMSVGVVAIDGLAFPGISTQSDGSEFGCPRDTSTC